MANKSQKQKSILEIPKSQKHPEITESQTNSNNIIIQYKYFEDIPTFNLAFDVLLTKTGWMISDNQFRKDRFDILTYDILNRHNSPVGKNFQLYLKGLKEWFTFYKILKSFEYHHTLYKQSKQSLLHQYGQFDKPTNQYVIYEDQNKINFSLELNKLHGQIIQLNTEKFSPKYFLFDFIDYFHELTREVWAESPSKIASRKAFTGTRLIFYDILNDIFNLSEIDTWETAQDLVDELYNNMLNI